MCTVNPYAKENYYSPAALEAAAARNVRGRVAPRVQSALAGDGTLQYRSRIEIAKERRDQRAREREGARRSRAREPGTDAGETGSATATSAAACRLPRGSCSAGGSGMKGGGGSATVVADVGRSLFVGIIVQ
jgi:hypothetical protein